jgi:3-deoxy-D-manno-octulosonic-acid transferase
MKKFWFLFYNYLIIPIFFILIHLASLFNAKIKKGIKGRRNLFEELNSNAAGLNRNKKLIWFHSSSLGEFEQAKPLIEELKKNSNINILVTFFSPSGLENSRKYPYADIVSYLPFDSKENAEKIISIVKPDLAVIMRYDIWPNIIWKMREKNIPVFIVDATMKESSLRKIPGLKNFHKNLFNNFSYILTVSEEDSNGFKEFKLDNTKIKHVGDTRFDRVFQRSRNAKEKSLIKQSILSNKKILIAGSSWEQDEEVLIPSFIKLSKFQKDLLLIIAPHEPTIQHLEKLENDFRGELDTIRFSHLNNYNNEPVIIVDSIGILLTLYTYADAAFIGGGFKQNVHNVLEAAVYGIPVLFGPKINNSQEAIKLAAAGGGIIVRNKKELYRNLRTLFGNESLLKDRGKKSFNYVHQNLGAAEKILKEFYRFI